jgi:hypothetical protein
VPPLILSVTLAVCLKQIAQAAVSQDDPRVAADISNNPLECLNGFDLAQASRYAGLLRARRRNRAQDRRTGRLDLEIGSK